MELVPYKGRRPSIVVPMEEGTYQGIIIAVADSHADFVLEKIETWFEERDEIILVDHCTSEKQGLVYIILEWEEVEIDPLFLAILRDEEMVEDFAIYLRNGEV